MKVRIAGIPKIVNATKKVRITKVPKAKTGNWIKGAVNPAHRGYCTPMTKATCTPARKAFAKRAKAHKLQSGGDTPITHGLPEDQHHLANIEAEGGEVYQNQQGGFRKIADSAPDHEQGGVMIPDAERVLEDTSTSRKDKYSKKLKMSPTEVDTIFGFKPKRPLSHAEAFDSVNEHYDKEVDKYNGKLKNTNDEETLDKLSANTVRLNMLNRDIVPGKQDVFNTLFEHQEAIKAVHQIPDDGKQKYGGFKPRIKVQTGGDATDNPDLGLYRGPKNPANRFTPTGKTSEAKLTDKQIVDSYKAAGVDFGTARGSDLQDKIYNYLIENQPEVLKASLKEYGANKKALQAGKGKIKAFSDPDNATKEDLKAALPYLKDSMLGARIPIPTTESSQTPGPGGNAAPPAADRPFVPKTGTPDATGNPQSVKEPENKFHEGTHWYDIAPAAAELADSLRRDPELFNPVQYHQLKYKLLNPSAALYANQADYEAGLHSLEGQNLGSGVNAANVSNLTAQKYKANNQVLGQYENQNTEIQNKETEYNTQVRDKQSMSDAATRANFYSNVLKSRDNQRIQKLQAIQDLSRVQQLKARQNTSGNLVSKLSPAFDQSGEYNGYQYVPVIDPETGETQSYMKKPGKSKTTTTTSYKIGNRNIRSATTDSQ
jgi:hypothetical protein